MNWAQPTKDRSGSNDRKNTRNTLILRIFSPNFCWCQKWLNHTWQSSDASTLITYLVQGSTSMSTYLREKLRFFTGKQSDSFSPRVSVYPWCHYLVVRVIPLGIGGQMSTMFEFTVKIIWYCGHMPMLILLVIKYFHLKRRIEKCMGAVYLLITLVSLP